ncbi:hypothetical protein [Acidiferrobacter sp.]|uniref:hypothetical protein n=1 Tax=Acidiferrobacter sp. TaxID=1872107 RepID=UPI00262BD8C7|nr:hypothetical protein [Acidiferrobacter sp.]
MPENTISTLYRKPCPSCARQYARDSRACPFCGYTEALATEAEEDQERLYGEYLAARRKQTHDEVERLRRAAALYPEDRTRERALALAISDEQALDREWATYHEGRQQRVLEEPAPRHITLSADSGGHEPAAVAGPVEEQARPLAHTDAPDQGREEAAHRKAPRQEMRHEPKEHVLAVEKDEQPSPTRVEESDAQTPAPVGANPVGANRERHHDPKRVGQHGGTHREAAHPEPPQRAMADKECPVCAATLPDGVERCVCGYVFGADVVIATSTCPHCTAPVVAGVERCRCGYPLAAQARPSGIPGLRRR